MRLVSAAILIAFILCIIGSPLHHARALHAMPCLDLNGDQQIAINDIVIEASYNGQTVPPAPAQADFDADGDVDEDDAAFYLEPWRYPPPGEPVTCQDTPIGPAGAVGGEAELADATTPNDGGPATGAWLAAAGAASLAGFVFTSSALVRRRR